MNTGRPAGGNPRIERASHLTEPLHATPPTPAAACDREQPLAPEPALHPSVPATALKSSAGLDPVAQLGEHVFNDRNLSLGRNQSCASCHDPAWGFSSPNSSINAAGSVMFGSVTGRFGNRKPPSAAYATRSPVLHFDAEDDTWVGGNFWDGRATGARLGSPSAEQALGPFVNPAEQALPDAACVIYRVSHGEYRTLFTAVTGHDSTSVAWPASTNALCAREGTTVPLSTADRLLVLADYDRVGLAVAAFEDSPVVNQFSSKYDAYLRGEATLSAVEKRGLALFNGKAGCAGCHPSDGPNALFTDFTYDNIGVPANPKNPALLSTGFVDVGLGGALHDRERDGAQKVPTLRNIDKRATAAGAKSYMHNGAFKSLDEVVHFYNTRDVLPSCGAVASPHSGVNCWPAPEVVRHVNRDELGNLGLTSQEEAAVVAYLKTLSDGYKMP
jgi:cytochrome c peroxidase